MRRGEEVKMNECKEHGDPYVDCDGEVRFREVRDVYLCTSHWGAYMALIAIGYVTLPYQNV